MKNASTEEIPMRILFIASLVLSLLISPLLAGKAQAQCLLCGIVGYAIGSSQNDSSAGASAGGGVIYVAPHIGERIADPLAVRISASSQMAFSSEGWRNVNVAYNMTLQEIFAASVENAENYTLLEIVRVIDGTENRHAVFYFAYIENEKIKPLSSLPSN